ncbi:SOS response-associated peptidase [Pontixanthobacter gangjinensis]|uniref:Abasic site processing protein n=1 Tax=Christiangramia aestuarii TaxID=1028746 RepID=A0A7K1LMB5_9FLAO|nr:SOS response-associated peptidase [Christiangramia aestuarii]MUP41873.1 SOS response-associated peptidase [Christiangramia aestuarii]
MCYETSLNKKLKVLEKTFDAQLKKDEEFEPYYHKSGFVHPNLYCIPIDQPGTIYPMEWGLVAPWGSKDINAFRKKYNTLNAKSENLLKSNMYKEAARERRCLIIVDGFFEPHHVNKVSYPYYCYLQDQKIFSIAGIYNELEDGKRTLSLITTEANDFFAEVHNNKKRMPLSMDPDFEGSWLDPGLSDMNLKELMQECFRKEAFKAHPVSRDLYKRGKDTNNPEILEEVDYNPDGLF